MNLRSGATGASDTLRDLGSLLASAGVPTVQELSEELRQNEDVDTQIIVTNHGILLYTSVRGIELTFPFTWHDFWAVVKELEEAYLGRPDPPTGDVPRDESGVD